MRCCRFAPNPSALVGSSQPGQLYLWELHPGGVTQKPAQCPKGKPAGRPRGAAFSYSAVLAATPAPWRIALDAPSRHAGACAIPCGLASASIIADGKLPAACRLFDFKLSWPTLSQLYAPLPLPLSRPFDHHSTDPPRKDGHHSDDNMKTIMHQLKPRHECWHSQPYTHPAGTPAWRAAPLCLWACTEMH